MRKAPVALLAVLVAGAGLGGAGPEAPDVKEIMKRANKPTGIYFNLKRDLEDDSPMWADMQAEARELAQLAAALSKQTPPKGDKASWAKRTRAYAADAQALAQAVAKRDKRAARAAHARMGGATCTNCHKAHRPE
jgi:hypothetical protein